MIVITGASDGLGLELAELHKEGAALQGGSEILAAAKEVETIDESLEILVR